MSYFKNIEDIMYGIEGWIDANTIHYPAPPGGLSRSPIVPGILDFHCQNKDLHENINKWSKEILPVLSYAETVDQITKLKNILEPHSGRDLYLFSFIVDKIDPEYKKKFINGMFGCVLNNSVQTHVFSDPDCSFTKESYFVYAYRRMFSNFMDSPIVSLFLFLRMLKTKRPDDVLTSCDDFCGMYDGMIEKDGDKYEIKKVLNDFFFSFKKVIINEDNFNFVNNPKKVYEITKDLFDKYETDHDLDYVGKYLEMLENRIDRKPISVTI